jgi:hypothetical protein
MAFVNRSERTIILTHKEEQEVGPGQYLPQGSPLKNQNPSKAPFNTNTYRNIELKKEDVPGPGSYQYDDKYEKMATRIWIDKQRQKQEPFYKALEYNIANNNGAYTLLASNSQKHVGFMSKEGRFKEKKPDAEVPGPGFYEKDNKYIPVNISMDKSNQMSTNNISLIAGAGIKNSPSQHQKQITGSPHRILSIPSKGKSFGYEIGKSGVLQMNEDPDKQLKHLGDKGESVGPGSYNIGKSWARNSLDWSKNLKERGSPYGQETINGMRSSLFQSQNSPLSNTLIESNNNSLENKMKKEVNKDHFIKQKEKVFKQIKERRNNLLNLNSVNNIESQHTDLVEKMLYREQPGPGYYYDSTYNNYNSKPERFQTFGSSSRRFQSNTSYNPETGPGSYFKQDEMKYDKAKFNNLKEKMNFKINKNRVKRKSSLDINEQKEVEHKLGPGSYDVTKDDILVRKSFSNINQFGSLQKRFIEKSLALENSPGPGAYLSSEIDKNNYEEKARKLVNKPRIRTYDPNPKEVFKHEKDSYEVPAVGSYNSDINSIANNVIVKNKFHSVNAPFSSMQKRFQKPNNSPEKVGPGYYYKEKIKNVDIFHPPFNSGDLRFYDSKQENEVGPGSYNKNSYFDWNKKTFNVLYL